jgi:hypothetical protein
MPLLTRAALEASRPRRTPITTVSRGTGTGPGTGTGTGTG